VVWGLVKTPDIKFHENPFSMILKLYPDRQEGRQAEIKKANYDTYLDTRQHPVTHHKTLTLVSDCKVTPTFQMMSL
jgi:hypothetical protein